jgi:hypothetical protein
MPETINELEAFNVFVDDELGGLNGITLQQALEEFLACRKSVEAIRDKLKQAHSESDRDESKPLDVESLKREVRKRLEAESITD